MVDIQLNQTEANLHITVKVLDDQQGFSVHQLCGDNECYLIDLP